MNIVIDNEFKALIPPLSSEERAQLEENLVADGCRDPLVVWLIREADQERDMAPVYMLIDGHNRYEICTRLDIPFDTVEMEFETKAEARIWMRGNQAGRRNLSPAWLIELALGNKEDLKEIGRSKISEAQKLRHESASEPDLSLSQNDKDTCGDARPSQVSQATSKAAPKAANEPAHNTQKEIAKAAGVSTGQIGMAEQVRKKAPDLWEKAKQGEVSISSAYKEIKKEEKKLERAAVIQKQRDDIEQGIVTLPQGVFEVIAMDPPWNYGREYDPDGSRVANPYPEMTQAQLLELEPPFADDSVLFLWTTHQFIFDAKELLSHWGFTYKATMVWDKERIGMGAWLRMQCEFCLVGVKGKPTWQNTTWRDVIREARREHSRKPDAFYKLVEEVTVGRRLEYFSREQRQGWEVVGNDTAKF